MKTVSSRLGVAVYSVWVWLVDSFKESRLFMVCYQTGGFFIVTSLGVLVKTGSWSPDTFLVGLGIVCWGLVYRLSSLEEPNLLRDEEGEQ